ncbi:MAG: iron-sulfur cluster assembly scaffold protein [Verrucomicrobiota bacterium]
MEDELAQAIIEEAYRNPRFRREGELGDGAVLVTNPLCGDEVWIEAMEGENGMEFRFDGQGCAVSQAGAELTCSVLNGKNKEEASSLAESLQKWLEGQGPFPEEASKAEALCLIKRIPERVRCALLGSEGARKAVESAEVG